MSEGNETERGRREGEGREREEMKKKRDITEGV